MSMENNGYNFDATNAAVLNGTYGLLQSTWNMKNTKELARYQNQLNIENWNMMNAYNSPAAQMQRFKDAGLNPNLIYGQGTPGNASSAPAADHVGSGFKLPDIQLGSMLMELKHQQLENKALKLQNDRSAIAVDQAALDYENKTRAFNAILAFQADKLQMDNPSFRYAWDYTGSNLDYWKKLRNTPEYKQMDILWQKGIINERNINNIGIRNNLLNWQQGRYQDIDKIFQMDFSDTSSFLKGLMYLLLIGAGKQTNF